MAKIGNFEFETTGVEGVTLIKPSIRQDERGFFLETFQHDSFADAGIIDNYVQDNHSRSKVDTFRGLHLQFPRYQKKIVRATIGEIDDVAVLVFPEGHQGYGKMVSVRLSAENKYQLSIGGNQDKNNPVLFAHGFRVVSDVAEVMYKASDYYSPEDEMGLDVFDQNIKDNIFIETKIDKSQLLADKKINPRDASWPGLSELTQQIWAKLPKNRKIFDLSPVVS